MTGRLVAIFCLTFALVLTTGCEDFLTLDDLTASLPAGSDPAQSQDPTVQAAGQTTKAIDSINQGDTVIKQALKANGDIAGADAAIKLRPADPLYRFYKSAFLVAAGKPAVGPLMEGEALIKQNRPNLSEAQADQAAHEGMLVALYNTLFSLDDDDPSRDPVAIERVTETYCNILEAYEAKFKDGRRTFPTHPCDNRTP
jgi:hypothetical protein